MGRLNKRELVSRLQVMGTASRASLAKSLGLSQPTAGKIVEQLLRAGIVEEIEEDSGESAKVGRPPQLLRLDRSQKRFLAIQLGVTKTSFAALPVGVGAEDRWQLELTTPGSSRGWVQQLRKAAETLETKDFWGVLVSLPGVVDEEAGRVLFSSNLHWSEGQELPELIQRVWNAPVILVQEERALALGHQMVEASEQGCLLVDFGEGVGGAVITRGRLQLNPLPINGELGHTPVYRNERQCGCGAKGCLETLVSTRGLLDSFANDQKLNEPSWPQLLSHVTEHGMPSWFAETLEQTAVVISGALNILGLQQVVITGSLLEFPAPVFEHLSQAISQGAMWGRFGRIDVKQAPRRRIEGLIAVGLDRLVLPVRFPEAKNNGEVLATEQIQS